MAARGGVPWLGAVVAVGTVALSEASPGEAARRLAGALVRNDRGELAAGAAGGGPLADLFRVHGARRALEAGRPEAALELAGEASDGPAAARLRAVRARALLEVGRVDEARTLWEAEPRTQRGKAEERGWLEALVRALHRAGRPVEADDALLAWAGRVRRDPGERFALDALERRLDSGALLPVPSPPSRILAVAETFASHKRSGRVAGLALRVLGAGGRASSAERARARRLLAEARARQKRGREAEALLAVLADDAALEAPVRGEATLRRGELLAARGELRAAEACFAAAAGIEGPHAAAALDKQAEAVAARAGPAAATGLRRAVGDRFPASWEAARALSRVGRDLRHAGDPGGAAAVYEEVLARFPSDREAPMARYLAGDAWAAAGKAEAARRHFEAGLARPAVPGLYALFSAQRLAGEPRGSLARRGGPGAEGFAARFPPGLRAGTGWVEPGDGLDAAGRERLHALRDAGLFEDLAEDLRAHLRGALADDPGARLALGFAWFAAGRFHESLAEFERVERDQGPEAGAGRLPPALAAPYLAGLFPRAYAPQIEAAARTHRLDPLFLTAIAREESHFDPDCQSWSDARGLVQMLPSTAVWMAGLAKRPPPDRLYEVEQNLDYGGLELADLARRYRGLGEPEALMMAGYNGGPGNVRRWLARTPLEPLAAFLAAMDRDETRLYVGKVGRALLAYELLARGAPGAGGGP